jgi:DNA processing protein
LCNAPQQNLRGWYLPLETLVDWISLSFAPGLGVNGLWKLIGRFNTPAAVFEASRKKLLEGGSVQQRQIAGLADRKSLVELARQELQRLESFGGTPICFTDDLYPKRLKQLPDPPPVIYVKGNLELLDAPGIAIVGSRAATAYGRRVSRTLAQGLAQQRVSVISGLALGIDTESHQGALDVAGDTVAVLGCGLDIAYPKQNSALLQSISERGLVVTEYTLGTRPEGFRFPARNRIIAALSEGIVVVEAAKRSGSLITAQIGLDIGREIFAVPGQVDSYKSEGAHWLLQQGAKLVGRVEDVLVEFGGSRLKAGAPEVHSPYENVDPDAVALLQQLEPYATARDDIIERSGLGVARATELLLYLELEGLVEVLPGSQVRKIV